MKRILAMNVPVSAEFKFRHEWLRRVEIEFNAGGTMAGHIFAVDNVDNVRAIWCISTVEVYWKD